MTFEEAEELARIQRRIDALRRAPCATCERRAQLRAVAGIVAVMVLVPFAFFVFAGIATACFTFAPVGVNG